MKEIYKVLLVDDDAIILFNSLAPIFKELDLEVEIAETPDQGLKKIAATDFDYVILDISLSPGKKEGLDLLPKFKRIAPQSSVIMLTSYSDNDMIAACMIKGASDYIVKSSLMDPDKMRSCLSSMLARSKRADDDLKGGKSLAQNVGMTARSEAMRNVYAKLYRIRNEHGMHVLITGESGTGKELAAKALSQAEEGRPFHSVNCAALTPSLFESEMFGHERGSFTGAERQKIGFFEMAHDGVLFLDEIATLNLDVQAKLLRVLQLGEFNRTGSTKILKVAVRIVAATNVDLHAMAKAGLFRSDLLQRIIGQTIYLPSLRERPEDIEPIVNAVIAKSNKPNLSMTPEVLKVLESCPWPGNIRQLEKAIQSAVLAANGDTIAIGDLPNSIYNVEEDTNAVKQSGLLLDGRPAHRSGAEYFLGIIKRYSHPTIELIAKVSGLSKSTVQRYLKLHEIDLKLLRTQRTAEEDKE